jgi:ribosome-interacting GTPase 1
VLLLVDLGNDDGGEQLRDAWEHIHQHRTRLGRHTAPDEEDTGTTWTRTFLVENKIDLPGTDDRREFFSEYIDLELETYAVSATAGTGLETLRDAIYAAMDVVRVYTRTPGKKDSELDAPFTLPRGGTVLELAGLIHKDLATNFRSARVWGAAVHDGTPVRGDYVLNDCDIVELHA